MRPAVCERRQTDLWRIIVQMCDPKPTRAYCCTKPNWIGSSRLWNNRPRPHSLGLLSLHIFSRKFPPAKIKCYTVSVLYQEEMCKRTCDVYQTAAKCCLPIGYKYSYVHKHTHRRTGRGAGGGSNPPIRAVCRHEFGQRVDIIRAKHNTCLNNTNLGSVTAVNGKNPATPQNMDPGKNFGYYPPPPLNMEPGKCLLLPPPH